MGVKKLSGGNTSASSEATKARVKAISKTVVELPTKKTVPSEHLGDYNLYIYGLQKIGKTSFTVEFPDALHFMFEPSGKAYEIFAVEPEDWNEFVAYIDKLIEQKKSGELKFKTFPLDTVDLLYQFCQDHVCGLLGIEHPQDANDFGKTYDKVSSEFRKQIVRLASVGGIIALTHEVEKEIETRSGAKYTSIVPSSQKRCNLILSKFCDLTGNYYINTKGERVLQIESHTDIEAGNRMGADHFNYSDGSNIEAVPMGSSSEEAYKNLCDAFQNNLDKPKPVAVKSESTAGVKKKSLKLRNSKTSQTQTGKK